MTTIVLQNGNVLTVNGTLTLCDTSENATTFPGKITGGYNIGNGGGVIVTDGLFIMEAGSISGNRAVAGNITYGGGVYATNSTITMDGGDITNNIAEAVESAAGGGVFITGLKEYTNPMY